MYSVWFRNQYGQTCIFVTLFDVREASKVADALMSEGFTEEAWVD